MISAPSSDPAPRAVPALPCLIGAARSKAARGGSAPWHLYCSPTWRHGADGDDKGPVYACSLPHVVPSDSLIVHGLVIGTPAGWV